MAYEKLGFVDNVTPLDAAHFNHMEEGIARANNVIETVGGDTLTWDGNTDGLVSMDAFAEMVGTFYKISDAVPTLEDCISGATYTVAYNGKQENRSAGYDDIAEMSGFCGCLCIGGFHAMVAPENNFQIEIEGVTAIFPEAGLYTPIGGDVILTSLTIPGYTGFAKEIIKQDALPEALRFGMVGGDTLTFSWDFEFSESDLVMGAFYKVSDKILVMDDFANGCAFGLATGEVVEMPAEAITELAPGVINVGDGAVVCVTETGIGVDVDGGSFPESGVYFMAYVTTALTVPGQTVFPGIKQLDEKYIPNIIPKINKAAVGQTVVVKAVDADGVPTKWEVIDKGMFVITMDTTTNTVDQTFDEIKAAIEAGRIVALKYYDHYVYMSRYSKDLLVEFRRNTFTPATSNADGEPLTWSISEKIFTINRDNEFSIDDNSGLVDDLKT